MMTYKFKTVKTGKLLANEEAEAAPLQKNMCGWRWRNTGTGLLEKTNTVYDIEVGGNSHWGAIEMITNILIKSNIPTISSVKPYTPLELVVGRDILRT